MSTVAKRLEAAHEHLLQLYSSIPILTPCLEKIKSNQAEFVIVNSRLRQLQEAYSTGYYKVEKAKKQLGSVFTINKADSWTAYNQEINELKSIEDGRRLCLRQRDVIVTERYKLHKERETLLEETRQLKKLNESVFDRSKDEVANADFPEELHWQLELKDYDIKIMEVRRQLLNYNTALSNLARAANLSEAALVAFLGYPDAAYKVWRVEYALKASQKMRLYLRVELSLSNAYSNEDVARQACSNIVPPLSTPIKPSAVQAYFEPVSKMRRVKPFDAEPELRAYIAQLRSAHKTAEMYVAQETERLNAMQKYRESIIPLLAKIRRHVFQDSCMGGSRIEGWEDEQGRSLLGTEADILVRGGIHQIGTPSSTRPSSLPNPSSSQSVPNLQQRNSVDGSMDEDEEFMNTGRDRRGSGRVPDANEQEVSIDPNRSVVVHGGRVVVSAGKAPLSIMSPSNVLGSEVLMAVDLERRAKLESKSKDKDQGGRRSRSRSRRDSDQMVGGSSMDNSTGSNAFSVLGSLIMSNSSNTNSNNAENSNTGVANQGEREGQKRNSRGLFGFARGRRGSNNGDEAVVPSGPTSQVFQFGRNSRSSIDLTSPAAEGERVQRGHRRNVPSISISTPDEGGQSSNVNPLRRTFFENASLVQLPSWNSPPTTTIATTSNPPSPPVDPVRPRVLTMDEYIGIGAVANRHDSGSFDLDQGPQPLIPSYEEHQQHQAVDPEILYLMNSSISYEGLSSLAEQDEEGSLFGSGNGPWAVQADSQSNYPDTQMMTSSRPPSSPSAASRVRSRSLSPHGYPRIHQSISNNEIMSGNSVEAGPSVIRTHYQRHHYSLSDQATEGICLDQIGLPPPPDYAKPPEYTV
ncbi:hypothetical protein BGX27_011430 [Mortierella sp. AM989]|nr:hypothetical protein BGX27_011430 [Mortierella sp. AM989]